SAALPAGAASRRPGSFLHAKTAKASSLPPSTRWFSAAQVPSVEQGEACIQLQRWRMFFMACEELFGFNGGSEWLVCHYRFQPRPIANGLQGGVQPLS
ncbi:MAG: hypothetical protein F4Y01_06325, partial [Gammaproteobacteria bacterium]|nr:hypothetical protein [Gammaproteobacteria bacterium]